MRAFFVAFLVSWMLGIVLGVLGLSIPILLIGGAVLVAVLAIVLRIHVPIIIVSLSLLFLGALYGVQDDVSDRPLCRFESVVKGEVVRVHRVADDSIQYVVRDELGCSILVTTSRFPEHNVGSILSIQGDSQLLFEIPIEYEGYVEYLVQENIDATMQFAEVSLIQKGEGNRLDGVRRRMRERVQLVFFEPDGSLVQAMLLAERGSLPDAVTEAFRRAGVSHVLAISGLHISLLAGMMVLVLMMFPIHPYVRVCFTIGLLWVYVVIIGFPISAVRATLFWSIVLIAFQLRLLVSLPTVVLITVTAMVTYVPEILSDVGFQLSVSAVFGIFLMLFLTRSLPRHMEARGFLDVVLVSVGAILATWPIVLYHFGTISFLGLIANTLIVPVIPFFLGLSIVSLLISFVSLPLAIVGSYGVHVLWLWMNFVSNMVSGFPFAYVEDVSISLWSIFLYYFVLFVISVFVMKKSHRSWREVWQ